MKRFPRVLFHHLKGISGWSALTISNIDIAKIINISYRRRRFRIFDVNNPYSLDITYYEPDVMINLYFYGKYSNFIHPETIHSITKRYKSEEDVKQEIYEIKLKMIHLNNYSKLKND